ncbi:MAG: pyridoxal-phosphate dependent enzyme [Steroidobacteraceae bacterium]
MPLHVETPLVESGPLGRAVGGRVFVKLESAQPTGSFKLRGFGHACGVRHAEGARRFLSSSGGNAGLAVAHAGRRLGVPVTVVVPETATARARQLLEAEGAQVIVRGASWQEANEYTQSLIGPDTAFFHPFDDPLAWVGHSTLVDEVAAAGLRPDAVVLSVGGGGLLCGVALGMQRHGWDDVPIIAAETEGAASYRAALEAGGPVEIARVASVATSLGARRVCERAWRWSLERPVVSALVSDIAALEACERFAGDHGVWVEPACGASLALAYGRHATLEPYRTVLVVACGGVTAPPELIREWTVAARTSDTRHS